MNNDFKDMYNKIAIPDKLDTVISESLSKARKDKVKKYRKGTIGVCTGAASIVILFTIGINASLAFASTINSVPVISSIANALQFHYDKNMIAGVNQNDGISVNKEVSNNNVSLTANNIIGDNKDKFILFTLKGEDKNIKDLLLDKFTISDGNNNTIIDSSSFKSQVLPSSVLNEKGDFLVLNTNGYKVIVSSLGDSLKSYAEKGETYGSIEIISTDNKDIPENLNINVTGLTEAYDMTYSKGNYNAFISKFNRKPISINGKWNLSVDAQTKNVKAEEYDNIKFSADNTDFKVVYFRIYPSHIETQICLGKNKVDNKQLWGIGTNSTTYKDNYKDLPYLIDENGNKYTVSPSDFSYNYAAKTVNAIFQSSYYNNPKHLYLVISQLNYVGGAPSTNISPIKIQIK